MKMNSLLIAILCLLPCVAAAVTVDFPHGGAASGYNCADCHTSHTVLGGSGYDNICLNCHRPGSPKGGSRPFTIADAANPFGTMTGVLPSRMYQTSHNWGSSDNSPAAGAAPPLMAAMTTNRLAARTNNRLACVRCHNQHDNSNSPFLRMANDRDQLCLDCHRSRNVRSHTAGSHPVGFNYTGAGSRVRTNPDQFNNPPLNANVGNPTADLGMAIAKKSGMLLCSSCHGVHYADSSSATFDNHSGFSDLRQADGNLLRTDLYGATADAVNICTNCHAGKKAHNGREQNIQCADCHGAHVEYDGNAVTLQQKTPNVWLVRRYMTISTISRSAKNQPVYFQSTTDKNYKDAAGNGVCQSCHEVPTGVGYPAEHNIFSAAVCNQCHFHNNATGSFSATGSCTTCHGYPPRGNSPGGPKGYAVYNGTPSPFTLESTSGHATHAGGSPYSKQCKECHQGNSHLSGTFQDVFKNTAGLVGALFGAVPTFNGSNPQAPGCANVYCHSDGAPRNAALVPVLTTKAIPSWANGRGAIVGQPDECLRCHDNATTLVTNSHGRHLSASIGCITCHSATVSGNSAIKGLLLHANGVKEVRFSGFTAAASRAVWTVATATCSGVYCHSTVQGANGAGVPSSYASPLWGGTLAGCGGCHQDMSGTQGTGGHILHASQSGNGRYGCNTCHSGAGAGSANHVNQIIDIKFSAPAGISGQYSLGSSVTPGAGYGSCASTTCHGSGNPLWGSGTTVTTCEKCHGSAATNPFYSTAIPKNISKTDAKTGAHSAHLVGTANISTAIVCLECHTVPAVVNAAGHMDGTTQVIYNGPLAKSQASAATSCATTWCHGGNTTLLPQNNPARTAPVWNVPFPTTSVLGTGGPSGTSGSGYCAQCHGYPPLTVSHTGKTAVTCIGCHPHLNADALTFNDKTRHVNGTVDASGSHAFPYAGSAHMAAAGTSLWPSCVTASCHANSAGGTYPVAAGTPPNCTGCHVQGLRVPVGTSSCWDCHGASATNGLPNSTAFPNINGNHNVHGAITACGTCHSGGGTGVATHGSSNRIAATPASVRVVFTGQGASPVWTLAVQTCSGTNCHGQGAPTWGATSATPVNGFPYSATQCDKCHGSAATNPFYSTAIPKVTVNTDTKVGAHTSHLAVPDGLTNAFTCTDCHGTVTLTGVTHMNGTTNFTWSTLASKGGALIPTYTFATGVCTNVYCHGASMPGGDTTGTNRTPTWNSTTYLPATIGAGGAACKTCHGFPPLPASGHPTLATAVPANFGNGTAIGPSCNCHANINTTGTTYANIFVNRAQHIDGTMQVSGGHAVPYDNHNADVVAAGGNTACLGCHAIGTAASVYPAAVTGNPPNCMSCHKKATPLHTGTTAGANCSSCHGTSTNTATGTKGIPTGAAFPDLTRGHSRGEHRVVCTTCHVLGASGGTGSGVNHGRGATAGPVRDGKPNVVGNFVTGITVTGGGVKGTSPTSVTCNHNLITGSGCSGNGTNRTW